MKSLETQSIHSVPSEKRLLVSFRSIKDVKVVILIGSRAEQDYASSNFRRINGKEKGKEVELR